MAWNRACGQENEDDMIFENGDFIQKPEGPRKKCK